MTKLRLTGPVLECGTREWRRNASDTAPAASGTFRYVKVLTGKADIVEATFRDGVSLPGEGEFVDLLVEVKGGSAGRVFCDAIGPWADPVAAAPPLRAAK